MLVAASNAMREALDQMHAAGSAFPSHEQLSSLALTPRAHADDRRLCEARRTAHARCNVPQAGFFSSMCLGVLTLCTAGCRLIRRPALFVPDCCPVG